MIDPTCLSCQSLWQEHASATTEHIKLDNKLQLAVLSQDQEVITALTLEVESAGALRKSTREAIRTHDVIHEFPQQTGGSRMEEHS